MTKAAAGTALVMCSYLRFCKQELDFTTFSARGGSRVCDSIDSPSYIEQSWSNGLPESFLAPHYIVKIKAAIEQFKWVEDVFPKPFTPSQVSV